jgi:large subunit ribosomal protein L10
MTREEKSNIVQEIKAKLESNSIFYIMDASGLSVEKTNSFRKECYKLGIDYRVVKNTLISKALDAANIDSSQFAPALKGFSGVIFTNENPSAPAKMIKSFRSKGNDKPLLKGAYIDNDIYLGESQLDALASIKTKDELVGEIIGMLLSPAQNVISALSNEERPDRKGAEVTE